MKRCRKWLCLLLCLGLLCLTAAGLAETASVPAIDHGQYTLDRVVVLSRHNLRAPNYGKDKAINRLTPNKWITWSGRPGELSLHGALLETMMGQYFRLWLESEGLFPRNYMPEEGAVRLYANAVQRTQATARYFGAGLLPVSSIPVELQGEYGKSDPTFVALINHMSDAYAQAVRDEVTALNGGKSLSEVRDDHAPAIRLLMDVMDMDESEAYQNGEYGDLLKDKCKLVLEEGAGPKTKGPFEVVNSVATALVFQYYEQPDDQKAAFGHELTEEDWAAIGSLIGVYQRCVLTAPSLAVNVAHPMLEAFYGEMNAQGRIFSFLCGHDSTVAAFLAALDVEDYVLPGSIEPRTPIGVKVVFERWLNGEGEAFWRARLVYQSARQLRDLQPLSLKTPPMSVPLSFRGLQGDEAGLIPETTMMLRFVEKIHMLEVLEERYP